jgi:hypothetical protein
MDCLNQTLRAGAVSDASRNAIEAELALVEDGNRALAGVVAAARVSNLNGYWEACPGAADWWRRALTVSDRINLFDAYQEQLDLLGGPFAATEAAEERFTRRYRGKTGFLHDLLHRGSTELMITVAPWREQDERSRAIARSLRVLNALLQRGDLRTPIDSLGLPREATRDPFDGEPLRVVHCKEGVVIYAPRGAKDDRGLGSPPRVDTGIAPPRK